MPNPDPRVDAYIAVAPDYARPILTELRRVLHAGGRGLEEDIQWGVPALVKKGIVCSFMAFEDHVAVWFHRGALLEDPEGLLRPGKTVAMRSIHFTALDEIRAAPLEALVKQATALDAELRTPRRTPRSRRKAR